MSGVVDISSAQGKRVAGVAEAIASQLLRDLRRGSGSSLTAFVIQGQLAAIVAYLVDHVGSRGAYEILQPVCDALVVPDDHN